MERPSAIELQHVRFSYEGHLVLEDVNLVIPDGDFVSIVGPNGGGKTTLLKLMLGLLHPSAGTIRVFGETPEKARPRIGYLPQHTRLDPKFPASVMDVVLMGRLGNGRAFGPYSRKDKEIAARTLKEIHLYHLKGAPFSSLSGGQRQRVLIARALVCDPELLLLDEPTSHLDVLVERELYELLQDLNKRCTVVLVSHDLGFVAQFVKSVVCVKRKVDMHPTSEVTGEVISEMYGSPMKMVRHDRSTAKVESSCFNS